MPSGFNLMFGGKFRKKYCSGHKYCGAVLREFLLSGVFDVVTKGASHLILK